MNTMRNLLFIFTAVVLAAFALPGMAAPSKTYSLFVENGSVGTAVPPISVSVWIKNESPPPNTANSNAGSFKFTFDGLIVVDPVAKPFTLYDCPTASSCVPDTTANASLSADHLTITVTNISPPIQQQGFYKVTFFVTSCGDGTVTAQVFSGSQINGAPFSGPKSDSDFFNAGTTGGHVHSASTTQIVCGSLACATANPLPVFAVPVDDGNGPVCSVGSPLLECVSAARGGDKDGFCTDNDLQYAVTNTIGLTDDTLKVEWMTDPAGVFAYRANFPDNAALSFAWIGTSPFPAESCLDTITGATTSSVANGTTPPTDLMPHPLTYLAADVQVNDHKIKVTTTAGLPTDHNFDIVIGPYSPDGGVTVTIERMTVTNVSNNNLTVTRALGGTSKHFHPATFDNMATPVMSTPMRIIQATVGPYTADDQEQMCIAQGPVGPVSGNYYYWVIDIGDGLIIH